MPKFSFSTPQKLLIGLSIFLFGATMLGLGAVIAAHQAEANRPIKLSYSTAVPVNAEGQPLANGANYGELINQTDGVSEFSWDGRRVVLFSPATAVFTADTITVTVGRAYIVIASPTLINFDQRQLEINGVSGLYDAGQAGLTVFEGSFTLPGQETAMPNSIILHDGVKFTTAVFSRGQLKIDPFWERVITTLTTLRILPLTLSDLEPPALSILRPEPGTIVDATAITVTGQSEAEAAVTLNGQSAVVDSNGQFSLQMTLQPGLNDILAISTDKAGNETRLALTYTYISETLPPAPAGLDLEFLSTGCAGDITAFLACMINNYRAQNLINSLTRLPALDSAARGHSLWMDENNRLSETDDEGNGFSERCQSYNTACDAGNIIFLNFPTPQAVLSAWDDDPAAKANLLGEHSNFGIGISGGYLTAVFN